MNFRYSLNELPERGIAMLRVSGDLEFDDRTAFSECLANLLTQPQQKLVLDLTGLLRITSVYMGTLIDIANKAKESGKTFTIIAGQRLTTVFCQTGVDKVASVLQGKG